VNGYRPTGWSRGSGTALTLARPTVKGGQIASERKADLAQAAVATCERLSRVPDQPLFSGHAWDLEPGTHRDCLTDLLCGLMIFPVPVSGAAAIPSDTALPADGKSAAIPRPGKRPGPPRRRS